MTSAAFIPSSHRKAAAVLMAALGCCAAMSAQAAPRILLIGNSLTLHGPAQAVQWDGNWGMAASAADKDYATQLSKMLAQGTGDDSWPIRRESAGVLETAPAQYGISPELSKYARQARLVVIQAGDNVDVRKVPLADFAQHYGRIAAAVRPAKGTLACVSTWWPSAEKDKLIQAACTQAGGVFVDISDIARAPANIARSERAFQNDGVASHPGDAGMKAIAQRIQRSVAQQQAR